MAPFGDAYDTSGLHSANEADSGSTATRSATTAAALSSLSSPLR